MDASFWKGYSKKTGRLTWRLATADDLLAMRRIKNVTERFLNQRQKVSPLLSSPVLLTLVAENEKGKVVDVLYVEAQVEICKMACTQAGFEETTGLAEDLHEWLKGVGFKSANIKMNLNLKETMAPQMKELGFTCVDDRFSHWQIDL